MISISFLAKRGVKEEIQTFDARKISPEIRKSVEELLKKNKASFEPKVLEIDISLFQCNQNQLSVLNAVKFPNSWYSIILYFQINLFSPKKKYVCVWIIKYMVYLGQWRLSPLMSTSLGTSHSFHSIHSILQNNLQIFLISISSFSAFSFISSTIWFHFPFISLVLLFDW